MPNPLDRSRLLRKARARRDEGGAAIFVVAVTLGLLAAMGVYGLSATTIDVRSAGHMREAAQARAAAEHALMLAADSFTPGTSGEIVRAMQSGRTAAGTDIQSTTCQTANAYNVSTNAQYRAAQACVTWNIQAMKNIAQGVNPWTVNQMADGTTPYTFASDSFGAVTNQAFVRVEVTNPVDVPPPPGTSLNDRFTFTQVTVTTFVDMKTAATVPALTRAMGRGRMTVGPYFRQ